MKFWPLLRVARLVRAGDPHKVIAACERELSKDPDNLLLRRCLALSYEQAQASNEALQQAQAVLASDAKDEIALRVAAHSSADLHRDDEAAGYAAAYLKVVEAPGHMSGSRWGGILAGLSGEGERVRSKWVPWAKDYLDWYANRRGIGKR